LQQLTQWTLNNPDRIREKMEEQKDTEQTIWVSCLVLDPISGSTNTSQTAD
jgi:hypothetical protein